jgi:hypothetical protein
MKITSLILGAALLVGGSSAILLADGPVAGGTGAPIVHTVKHHPRKRQVNRRLKRQLKRIRAKERAGKLSPAEAAKLRKHDLQIHQEEKDMAAQDGGHLTQQDQSTLNQQLNQNSKEIKNQ